MAGVATAEVRRRRALPIVLRVSDQYCVFVKIAGELSGFSAVRACLRVVMLAGAVAYLAFMIASHRVPFSSGLEVFLACGGWLVLATVLVQQVVELRGFSREARVPLRRALSGLRSRWSVAAYGALMVAVLAAAGVTGLSGNLPTNCDHSDPAATCIRIDNWAESHGEYFRQYPYDAQGNSDLGAAWVPISRGEYVAEVGTRLRSAALFGVFSLGLALLASVLGEGAASASRERRRLSS